GDVHAYRRAADARHQPQPIRYRVPAVKTDRNRVAVGGEIRHRPRTRPAEVGTPAGVGTDVVRAVRPVRGDAYGLVAGERCGDILPCEGDFQPAAVVR